MGEKNNDKIKAARFQLGQFFKARWEEMGHNEDTVARHLGITVNTLRGIASGRFAWDIDLNFRICEALEIKPYFSTSSPDDAEVDFMDRKESDPERYHGYYIVENLLLWPDQLGILKLSYPRLFVRFNYAESYFSGYEDWKANHTVVEWLDPEDKPKTEDEIDFYLTEFWNFLAQHEEEEERLANSDDEF